MKSLVCELSTQVEELTKKARTVDRNARDALSAQNRGLATRYIRSKLALEKLVAKRSGMLAQLEDTYNSIKDAFDHVQFMAAVRLSTEVLHDLNSRLGGPEEVSNALDSLQEENLQSEEVSNALGQLGAADTASDEGHLELALERLELEETSVRLDSIGSVPQQTLEPPGIQEPDEVRPIATESEQSRSPDQAEVAS